MKARQRVVPLIVVALSIGSGCATGATLGVRYPEQDAHASVLASVPPRRVTVVPVVDQRADITRVGSWPKDAGAIVTNEPVVDIVRAALVTELTANGHAIVFEAPDVVIATTVEAFWLETVRSYPGWQYLGRVVILVRVTDGRSGSLLLNRRFIGIKRAQADAASKGVSRDVLDDALARVVHDLATDPEMLVVFREAGSNLGRCTEPSFFGRTVSVRAMQCSGLNRQARSP